MANHIEVNGQQIEIYQREIDSAQPYLVFLHEGLGCIQMWRGFPDEIATATGCNLLVYSRAGYGDSSPAALPRQVKFMHDEGLDVLPAVLEKLNIGRHILIGHSDGGSIALINGGGVRPSNLMGIVTLAAHVFNEEVCVKSIEAVREMYKTTSMRQKLAKYHTDVDNAFWGWCDIWLHPDFWHWNIEEFLPTIQVPLLAIQGLDDQYGTLAQVEAILAGVGEQATKELIPDCKHSPHLEQREATATAIVGFVNSLLAEGV